MADSEAHRATATLWRVTVAHASRCRLYCPGAYQRERFDSRRGSRGFASLTVRVRPANSLPWSPAMALFAVVLSGISTKPKPLERPVSRSIMTRISSTTPYGSKSWRRSSSVVVKPDYQHKYSRKGPCGQWCKQSPGHPNRMQEQTMQEPPV